MCINIPLLSFELNVLSFVRLTMSFSEHDIHISKLIAIDNDAPR